MASQSTRHLLLIEPALFGYNSETAATNTFQVDARESAGSVHARALSEFRVFRDSLVDAGVAVTTLRGPKSCPDAVFPNWFSTHTDGSAFLYPMMATNRQRERSDDIVGFLKKFYAIKDDFLTAELQGQALEGMSSMVLDRVHHVAYVGRSKRSDENLARQWCARMGFEPVIFDTVDHTGRPVYNTNVALWIGSEIAGVATQSIAETDRERVLKSIARHHEVLELDNAQLRHYCGNALEIRGADDLPMLMMSDTAYGMLTSDQISRLNRYYAKTLSPKIPTIETYGGGSARSMVQELF